MHTIRKWLAIMGILVGDLAMGLSFSLINTNLESIHAQFGATIIELQWMINIYGIFIASNLVTMGRLGDIFGRKKIYLIGLILFVTFHLKYNRTNILTNVLENLLRKNHRNFPRCFLVKFCL